MKISPRQYALSLYELTVDNNKENILKDFVGFLIKNNDYGKIDEIISEFSKIWDEKNGKLSVNLISAHKLENNAKKNIVDYLKNKTGFHDIEFNESIDSSIIGGVVLRYGDKIIDGSIKNNLNNLKNKINK